MLDFFREPSSPALCTRLSVGQNDCFERPSRRGDISARKREEWASRLESALDCVGEQMDDSIRNGKNERQRRANRK